MNIFKLLSDNTKLEIVRFLLDCRCCDCICHVRDHVKKDHSVVLKAMQKLEKAGIVWTRKEGRMLKCGLNDKNTLKRLLKIAEEIKDGKEEKFSKKNV